MLKLDNNNKLEVIEFGEYKMKVRVELPVDFILSHSDVEGINDKKPQEQIRGTRDYVRDILYIENDKKLVDEFVSKLSLKNLIKVVNFITTLLNEYAKKDEVKKKGTHD